MPPTLFLDIDDVLCLNNPYGGHDLQRLSYPVDFWEKLFSNQAVQIMNAVMRQYSPAIVVTSSWVRFLDRTAAEQLFNRTGLTTVAAALHRDWCAPENRGDNRLAAINRWLSAHPDVLNYLILDDVESGTGLSPSKHSRAGRLVLCQVGEGLQEKHLTKVNFALTKVGPL